jgi:signal peptidase I
VVDGRSDARAGDAPVTAPRASAGGRLLGAGFELLTTAVLAIVIYLVVQAFVVQTYRVEMHSMEPTLLEGQHLLIDKLTPRFDDYSRGDVVVFRPPGATDEDTPFIKRVIGVSGDQVEIRNGGIVLNGTPIREHYVATDGPTDARCGERSWTVAQGELFVLGDHRSASDDSRCFGTVSTERVIGRAWLRFWPFDTLTILQTPTYPEVSSAGG